MSLLFLWKGCGCLKGHLIILQEEEWCKKLPCWQQFRLTNTVFGSMWWPSTFLAEGLLVTFKHVLFGLLVQQQLTGVLLCRRW